MDCEMERKVTEDDEDAAGVRFDGSAERATLRDLTVASEAGALLCYEYSKRVLNRVSGSAY